MSSPHRPDRTAPSVPAADAIAAAILTAIGEERADIASAYLFGSAAEGRAHRESDIDIGVLLGWLAHPTRAERFEIGIRLAGRLQAALARPVDLVILNDAPPLLGRAIATRGQRLVCRDARLDHEYVRDVQLRAADLEPWLRRMRQRKLESLRG